LATKRLRSSGHWEFIVKRKHLLATPLYLTFDSEAQGDEYVRKLEALLDRGIVPDEFKNDPDQPRTIAEVISRYQAAQSIPESERMWLKAIAQRLGDTRLQLINYSWAETWITTMKRESHLSPSTIRHHVGALARCFDWAERKGISAFIPNPLRKLPQRYAAYTEADSSPLLALGKDVPQDVERDRRLSPDEEKRIRNVLAGEKPEDRQRPLELKWQGALECLFDLAIESAMRMREMYSVSFDQIDFERRTIFLEKTKNGDKRQVPMTTVAQEVILRYLQQIERGERGMTGFRREKGLLFPWWDGDPVSFSATTSLLSRQFSRVFDAAKCKDLRFHDLRHEATSRFFERTKLSDIQISKITGHKEPRVLRRYANLRGSDLAIHLW
jgi:integrase